MKSINQKLPPTIDIFKIFRPSLGDLVSFSIILFPGAVIEARASGFFFCIVLFGLVWFLNVLVNY